MRKYLDQEHESRVSSNQGYLVIWEDEDPSSTQQSSRLREEPRNHHPNRQPPHWGYRVRHDNSTQMHPCRSLVERGHSEPGILPSTPTRADEERGMCKDDRPGFDRRVYAGSTNEENRRHKKHNGRRHLEEKRHRNHPPQAVCGRGRRWIGPTFCEAKSWEKQAGKVEGGPIIGKIS